MAENTIARLTLDTNLIQEYFKSQPKVEVVKALLELANKGWVELAVTSRIREDIPSDPLASRLTELPELRIIETGSVFRIGRGVIGRDMLGSADFQGFWPKAQELSGKRVGEKRALDWRDWDHLHAHFLLKRDVFLTWDKGVLCLKGELQGQFKIRVVKPEEYLKELSLRG